MLLTVLVDFLFVASNSQQTLVVYTIVYVILYTCHVYIVHTRFPTLRDITVRDARIPYYTAIPQCCNQTILYTVRP